MNTGRAYAQEDGHVAGPPRSRNQRNRAALERYFVSQELGVTARSARLDRHHAAADSRRPARGRPSHAGRARLRGRGLDDGSAGLRRLRRRDRRADGLPARPVAQSGQPGGLDGHERRLDACLQRVCQHGTCTGCIRAVSGSGHDCHRPR